MADKLTYHGSGVNYDVLDPIKILAQQAGAASKTNIADTPFAEVDASRGESAYVIDAGAFYLAMIEECLGTKALVADAMREHTGKTYYDQIAQDTVAMMVNDIVSVGARPLSVLAYWAVGESEWFADEARASDLINGWARACEMAGATWGGGETPGLKGVVQSGRIDLAGACVGVVDPKSRLTIGKPLDAGTAIVLLESSGIHANGLSLARKIAEQLPEGYATEIADGTLYGEALLTPTFIYAKTIQAMFEAGVDVRYLANITGHGWRKLMRHSAGVTYRITDVPPVPEVLRFMQSQAGLSDAEAYESLNMGAGYAVFVAPDDVPAAINAAKAQGLHAWHAGTVEAGAKQVVVEPLGVTYDGASLQVRA